ncbi:hypothetical protein ANN_01861 [Periplaneta americana]|uniref:Reverse transcriptase domain-containing protein n=1 Tax=Periplaneta americana TaxID=6978 RepID=A0ABQ8TXN3_PERAM|nr:hypothetical protein ANN_01861 [Periplaneta americana]
MRFQPMEQFYYVRCGPGVKSGQRFSNMAVTAALISVMLAPLWTHYSIIQICTRMGMLMLVEAVRVKILQYQLLVYADDVNMLGENPQTFRENAEILVEASKAIGLEDLNVCFYVTLVVVGRTQNGRFHEPERSVIFVDTMLLITTATELMNTEYYHEVATGVAQSDKALVCRSEVAPGRGFDPRLG